MVPSSSEDKKKCQLGDCVSVVPKINIYEKDILLETIYVRFKGY